MTGLRLWYSWPAAMKNSLTIAALGILAAFVNDGCGRDSLQTGSTSGPIVGDGLFCPSGGIAAPDFSASMAAPPPEPRAPVQSVCTFKGLTDATTESAMSILVRLVTGADDLAQVKLLLSTGLSALNAKDRPSLIARLLSEKASRDLSDQWISKWLELPTLAPFPDRFSSQIWSDLREQTLRHGRAVFIESSMKLNSLVDSTNSFANAAVARYYDVPVPLGDGFDQIQLPTSRVGVLGHAAVLGSHPSVSSRGNLLLRSFLQCQTAPPPPQGISAHDVQQTKLVARQQLAAQIPNSACTACHRILDVGFLLHSFDELGRVRKVDTDGAPLNTKVEFFADDGSLLAADQLSTFAKEIQLQGRWKLCLAQSLVQIAEARTQRKLFSEPTDQCSAADTLARQMDQNTSMIETLRLLADLIFGATVSGTNVTRLADVPLGKPTSLGIDGQLTQCTVVGADEINCGSICEQQHNTCTNATCRVEGTLGGMFFFKDRASCEAGVFRSVRTQTCSTNLNLEACNHREPLRLVRCCCD